MPTINGMTFAEYRNTPQSRIASLTSAVFYMCIGRGGPEHVRNSTMKQRIVYANALIVARMPDQVDEIWANVEYKINMDVFQYPNKDRSMELRLLELM